MSQELENSIPLDEMYILTTKQYAQNYIYKIGTSNNTPKRLQSLNLSSLKEDELYICHRAKCFDVNSAEIHIHTLLHIYRLQNNRDLFVIEFDDMREIVNCVCQCYCNNYNVFMQITKNSQTRVLPETGPIIPPAISSEANENFKGSNINVIT